MTFWIVDMSQTEGELSELMPYIMMPEHNDQNWTKAKSAWYSKTKPTPTGQKRNTSSTASWISGKAKGDTDCPPSNRSLDW